VRWTARETIAGESRYRELHEFPYVGTATPSKRWPGKPGTILYSSDGIAIELND